MLQVLLSEARRRFPVAGAVAAVLHSGGIVTAAEGIADLRTGRPVHADTVFPVYSVGKLFTATLALQACEAGGRSLDETVVHSLPGFRLGDGRSSAAITLRQLLTHSSGIPGDVLTDTGDDDDCLARYVQACSGLEPFHAPGALVSYSNAGFAVLGRWLEVARGRPFTRLLAEELLGPLQIPGRIRTRDEAARTQRHGSRTGEFANTYLRDPRTGEFAPVPAAPYPRSLEPAGARLAMSATGLLSFAALHLSGGRAAGGARLLMPASVESMQVLTARMPPGLEVAGFGLGWMIAATSETPIIGHDGASIVFLRLLPRQQAAVALLTNGGQADELFRWLFPRVLEGYFGMRPGAPPVAAHPGSPLEHYTGEFHNRGLGVSVAVRGDALELTQLAMPGATSVLDPRPSGLVPLGGDVFAIASVDGARIAFFGERQGGRLPWLQYGPRALARSPGLM